MVDDIKHSDLACAIAKNIHRQFVGKLFVTTTEYVDSLYIQPEAVFPELALLVGVGPWGHNGIIAHFLYGERVEVRYLNIEDFLHGWSVATEDYPNIGYQKLYTCLDSF